MLSLQRKLSHNEISSTAWVLFLNFNYFIDFFFIFWSQNIQDWIQQGLALQSKAQRSTSVAQRNYTNKKSATPVLQSSLEKTAWLMQHVGMGVQPHRGCLRPWSSWARWGRRGNCAPGEGCQDGSVCLAHALWAGFRLVGCRASRCRERAPCEHRAVRCRGGPCMLWASAGLIPTYSLSHQSFRHPSGMLQSHSKL